MRTVACNIGRIAVVLDGMDLTDAQWAVLEPTFRPRRRPDGRGRPWIDPRAVMNGVLRVLRTGAPWPGVPDGSTVGDDTLLTLGAREDVFDYNQ
jgi:hypothetical protein